jgi:hypothetical protein
MLVTLGATPQARGDRVVELHHHDECDAPVGDENAEQRSKRVECLGDDDALLNRPEP